MLCGTGEAEISCCGRKLRPAAAKPEDSGHKIFAEETEGDYYVTLNHEMEKQHFISFVAWVTYDRVLLIKLYPEQSAEVRFPKSRGGRLYFYCNRHGLFEASIKA